MTSRSLTVLGPGGGSKRPKATTHLVAMDRSSDAQGRPLRHGAHGHRHCLRRRAPAAALVRPARGDRGPAREACREG
eukprot:2873601-Pyramimonas_sp.AAC.1